MSVRIVRRLSVLGVLVLSFIAFGLASDYFMRKTENPRVAERALFGRDGRAADPAPSITSVPLVTELVPTTVVAPVKPTPKATTIASVPTSRPAPVPTTTVPPSTSVPVQPGIGEAEQRVLDLTNAERGKAGCAPLSWDGRLAKAALGHSSDMSQQNYFSHTSQDGRSFVDRIKAAGYPSPAAENIAKGYRTADAVMTGWMNSSGHRANILNCGLKTLGVGLDTRGFLWTQDFGR